MHLINTVLQSAVDAVPELGYTEFSEPSGRETGRISRGYLCPLKVLGV